MDTHGTWGHARWEQACKNHGITPLFGAEAKVDGRAAWYLAESRPEFYRFSSSNPTTPEDFANATGVVRFAGAALSDPECFDYVDVNPRSLIAGQEAVELSRTTGKPLVLTPDNDYPGPDLRAAFLAWNDSKKVTPQHILGPDEFRQAFWWMDDTTYKKALKNTIELGERLAGLELERAPMIHVDGDLWDLVHEGQKYRLEAGHIAEWTEEYEARLHREMDMIFKKDYQSYFLVVADLVIWAKSKMLVGPARGSSAGSLVCYLLRITEVDPLPYGLLFERFIDINRDDLPDIDIDFNDKKRELCFKYLQDKYGIENVAHIGSISTLKPRSVMAHVGKKMNIPVNATFAVKNVLYEYSSGDSRYGYALQDTLNDTKPGQNFMAEYPEAALMGKLENHASHSGVHAAGIIVSNEPVTEYCTVRDGVAQIDKKDAEYLNLLKIDALGLRTLGVIEDAGVVDNETLYGLKMDDPEVLRIFDEAKFSGVFQFEGAAQRRISIQVPMTSFKKIDHVTALARPGPLGGGATNRYILRNQGDEPVEYLHESMAEYLSDTMGVVLYQEQVMRIVRELGQFSWEETSIIRKAMSGRKGEEFFNQKGRDFADGAEKAGIDREIAEEMWKQIVSFGAWGMNKSHTTSYAVISYWCAYMKRHYPIEYAAACLRNAKDDDQSLEILREIVAEGVPYEPFDVDLSLANWTAAEGKLIGGFTNLVGFGPVKAAQMVDKREKGKLTEKDLEKIHKAKVKLNDLRPAHTKYSDIYENPENYNIKGRVREFADLEDNDNAVVVCQLVRRERRDRNEAVLINRRGGERKTGQTQFLDMFVVDDSMSKPVLARVNEKDWNRIGEKIADRAVDRDDWFLIRGRWLAQFSMMLIKKIKCLTNPEIS